MRVKLVNRNTLFWFFALPVMSLGNGWILSLAGLNLNFIILFFFLLFIIPFYSLNKISFIKNKKTYHTVNQASSSLSFSNFLFILLIILFSIVAYGIFVGIQNKYPLENVLRHASTLLFFMSGIVIFWLRPSVENVFKLFKFLFFVILIQSVIVYLSVTSVISPGVAVFLQPITYGVIGGNEYGFARAFMSHQIALFPYLSLLYFSKENSRKIQFFVWSVLLLFLTATRAFLIVIFCIILTYHIVKFARRPLYSIILTLCVILQILVVQTLNKDIGTWISSITDFSGKNVSNSFRALQMNWFIRYISDNPFWGYGFGFTMPEYQSDPVKTYSYELIFMSLWASLGIIGFLFLIFVYFSPFFIALQKFKSSDQRLHFIVGIVSANFASLGNPFLLSQASILMIVIAYYLLSLPSEKHKDLCLSGL